MQAALAVKAYATWRDGEASKPPRAMGVYRSVEEELGEWVSDAWYAGQSMQVCFYEGWCKPFHVRDVLERIEGLVREVTRRVLGEGTGV